MGERGGLKGRRTGLRNEQLGTKPVKRVERAATSLTVSGLCVSASLVSLPHARLCGKPWPWPPPRVGALSKKPPQGPKGGKRGGEEERPKEGIQMISPGNPRHLTSTSIENSATGQQGPSVFMPRHLPPSSHLALARRPPARSLSSVRAHKALPASYLLPAPWAGYVAS